MLSANKDSFLKLVCLGIGHHVYALPENLDWKTIQLFAVRHGLSAIVIDGIEQLPDNKRPPKEKLLEWIGEVLQNYEQRYEQYQKAIGEMAGFYNSHGFKMMVLKGYACALDWPKPKHRPCGDIDIWLFGKQKEVDGIISKEKGIKIDSSHHHHTVFEWGAFTVENHYDFINVHGRRSSAELEKVFKELGCEANLSGNDNLDGNHIQSVDVCGEKIYLPSPNLHALFLIRHMVSHFAAAEISLRQVLDWAFFVKKYTKEINWDWLHEKLERYHMKDFYNLINVICVEDLGFGTEIFPSVQFLPDLKEKVLADIVEPAYGATEPKQLLPRLVYKYKRWQGNAWKQRLCYSESRMSAFWGGFWSKLLKPASF